MIVKRRKLFKKQKNKSDYLPINRWPQDERPREKLIKYGCEYLSNSELLAIMLRTGISNNSHSRSALDLAKALLSKYKHLNELLDVSAPELTEVKGIGRAKACQIIASLELGRRALSEKNGNNVRFRCSEEVANYYIPLLKSLKREQFRILLLNIKNKLIKEVLISMGSLTSSVARLVKSIVSGHAKSIVNPA